MSLHLFLFFIFLCSFSFLLAEEREDLIPFPAPPGEGLILSFGLFRGEVTLYLGARGSVWRYGLIGRRWARIFSGNDPVMEILGSLTQEGIWIVTQNHAHYISGFLKKPLTLLLPSAKGGDWEGEEVLLFGDQLLLRGKGLKLRSFSYPQGISSAVLYKGEGILLESAGKMIPMNPIPLPLNPPPDQQPWLDLKHCEDQLFALSEKGWELLLPQPSPQPYRGTEIICALGGGGVLLTQEGLFYSPTSTLIGKQPHGTIGRGSAVVEGDKLRFAFPFPQGIRLKDYPLTKEEGASSSLSCLKPLDQLLSQITNRAPVKEEHLHEWLQRSRSAGWIPRVKIGGDLDRTLGLAIAELVPYSTSVERRAILIGPSLSTLDRTTRWNYTARIELYWDLDRVLFSDDETRIVTAWERMVRERERELLFAQTLWTTLSRRENPPEEREGARALFLTLWGVDPLFPTPLCQREFQRETPR